MRSIGSGKGNLSLIFESMQSRYTVLTRATTNDVTTAANDNFGSNETICHACYSRSMNQRNVTREEKN